MTRLVEVELFSDCLGLGYRLRCRHPEEWFERLEYTERDQPHEPVIARLWRRFQTDHPCDNMLPEQIQRFVDRVPEDTP